MWFSHTVFFRTAVSTVWKHRSTSFDVKMTILFLRYPHIKCRSLCWRVRGLYYVHFQAKIMLRSLILSHITVSKFIALAKFVFVSMLSATNGSICLLNIYSVMKQNFYLFYTLHILKRNLLECYPERSVLIFFLFAIFVSTEENTDWCGMTLWTARWSWERGKTTMCKMQRMERTDTLSVRYNLTLYSS